MNVTITTYDAPGYVGGPNSWLCGLIPFLQRAGIQLEVLFFIEGGLPEHCAYYRAIRKLGVKCRSTSSSAPMFEQVRWLVQHLADCPPSVLLINMGLPAYVAARWTRRAGIPTIGILHSDDAMYEQIFNSFAQGEPGSRVSDLVSVSSFLAEKTSEADTDTRMHQIPYGVPVPGRAATPPGDRLRMIYVGRLVEEQKQIVAVSRSLCRAVREIQNTEAILYGEGADRKRVEDTLRQENMGDRVRLGGNIENSRIQEVMLQAHVLVLLSDYEGLPVAQLEAMACGVVPVCLDIRSGVGQLIENGNNGYLVKNRGDDFVAAIRNMAADSELWSRLSGAARSLVSKQYSDELNATRWLKLLRDRSGEASASEEARQSLTSGLKTLDFMNRTVDRHNKEMVKPG